MIEIEGNLWDFYMKRDYVICITTNGCVKKNGLAVCGRGTALQATQQIRSFAKLLGERIKKYGNVAGLMQTEPDEWEVFIFPVKHNWWEKASENLILASAHVLFELAKASPDITFILPRPGCYNGKLVWEDVKKLIEFLPDNVKVIHLRDVRI